jgi:hypothetical protein
MFKIIFSPLPLYHRCSIQPSVRRHVRQFKAVHVLNFSMNYVQVLNPVNEFGDSDDCINMSRLRLSPSNCHPCTFRSSLSLGNSVGRYFVGKAVAAVVGEEVEGAAVEVNPAEIKLEVHPRHRSIWPGLIDHPYLSSPEGSPSRPAPSDPEGKQNTPSLLNNHSPDVKLVEVHGLKCTALRKSGST